MLGGTNNTFNTMINSDLEQHQSSMSKNKEPVTISSLLQLLIQLNSLADSNTQIQLFSYATRLLSSKLFPTISSSSTLSDMLRKRCVKVNASQAARFSKLLDAFLANDLVGTKWSHLYFLYSLSNTANLMEIGVNSFSVVDDLSSNMVGGYEPSMSRSHSQSIYIQQQQQQQQPQQQKITPLPRTSTSSLLLSQQQTPTQSMIFSTPPAPSMPEKKVRPQTLVTEQKILSCILSAFQSSPSEYIQIDKKSRRFMCRNPEHLSFNPHLVADILKLPTLHYSIRSIIDERSETTNSLLFQAVLSCIEQDLMQYYQLVSRLEQHLISVSLLQLLHWCNPVLIVLESIESLLKTLEGNQALSGHQLLSALYKFSQYGDTERFSLFQNYLSTATRVYFSILYKYAETGILEDPFGEFFCKQSPVGNNGDRWWDSITMVSNACPSFLPQDFAKTVYINGKSRYFLFKLDSIVSDHDSNAQFSIETMPRLIDQVSKQSKLINRQLMRVLQDKFHIFDQFDAIKNYLLMGHGDFVYELTCLLCDELDKPASILLRHALVQRMDSCLRMTNAQFDPQHILSRVDVRLLESSNDADLGWDVFSLDYRVDGPLLAVFSDDLMILYLRLFNFLWRLKRVKYKIGHCWSRIMQDGRLVADYIHIRRIIVFISQIEDYIFVDGVEKSWSQFLRRVHPDEIDFETLLQIHRKYCKFICTNLFGSDNEQLSADLIKIILQIFKDVIEYTKSLDSICDLLENYDKVLASVPDRSVTGGWGRTEGSDRDKERNLQMLLVKIKEAVCRKEKYQADFQVRLGQFIGLLLRSERLTSLAFRIDFNNYYKSDKSEVEVVICK